MTKIQLPIDIYISVSENVLCTVLEQTTANNNTNAKFNTSGKMFYCNSLLYQMQYLTESRVV